MRREKRPCATMPWRLPTAYMRQPRHKTTKDPKQVRVLPCKAPWTTWFNCPALPKNVPVSQRARACGTCGSPVSGSLRSTPYPGWLSYHSLSRAPLCPVPSDPQLTRGAPFPTFPQPKPPSPGKHATGSHSAATRESREPQGRGVASRVRESSAPLPKRKPTIKRPATSTSAPTHSQRGRRQATKVESASCRGFHISARPAGPPGTCASAVAPQQRGNGTDASPHQRRAFQLLRARKRPPPRTLVSPP